MENILKIVLCVLILLILFGAAASLFFAIRQYPPLKKLKRNLDMLHKEREPAYEEAKALELQREKGEEIDGERLTELSEKLNFLLQRKLSIEETIKQKKNCLQWSAGLFLSAVILVVIGVIFNM